jgi:hypothetical protein
MTPAALPRQPACTAAAQHPVSPVVCGDINRIGTQSAVFTPTTTPGRVATSASALISGCAPAGRSSHDTTPAPCTCCTVTTPAGTTVSRAPNPAAKRSNLCHSFGQQRHRETGCEPTVLW